MNQPISRGHRIPGLDGVRGAAVVLVVISHAGIGILGSAAIVGVTMFFVLSGYLITRLLLDEVSEGGISLRAFYARRAIRLLPALAVYLVGFAIIVQWLHLDVSIWASSWPAMFYFANYAQVFGDGLVAHEHLWSLAVEEHFYVFWPLIVGAGLIRGTRVLGLSVLALLVWRGAVGTWDASWAYLGSDTNAYALGLGCLLAFYEHNARLPHLPSWLVPASFAVLLALGSLPLSDGTLSVWSQLGVPPAAALASVALVAGVVSSRSHLMDSHILGWFGMISYSLYLWHLPLMRLPAFGGSALSRLLGAAFAVLVASASWSLLEGPLLRSNLAKRFRPGFQSRPGSVTAPSESC